MQITSRCKSFGNKIYGVSGDFNSTQIMFTDFGTNGLKTTAKKTN